MIGQLAPNELFILFDQCAMQFDPHTNCRTMKIPGLTFHALGEVGERYFTEQASKILGGPAEFFMDANNSDRFYLCIGAELVNHFGFAMGPVEGLKIQALYPPPPQPLMAVAPQYQPLTPESGYGSPVEAPQNPLWAMNQLNIDPNALGEPSPQVQNAVPVPAPAQAPEEPPRARKDKNRVKRPPNAWILFRQAQNRVVMQKNPGMHVSQVSKTISEMWQSLRGDDRKQWFKLAREKRAEHKRLYPDYQYPKPKEPEK
ncbi:hypothetical protein RRF57_011862 [Xylaria bambusicola]|uniref:HMG box domain-containing protein n=1 Tax=Xylaria bambusicola TaxID=326684 RepID=A0AAN7UNJ6_9PEZI